MLARGLSDRGQLACPVAPDAALWGRAAWAGRPVPVVDAGTDPLLATVRDAVQATGIGVALAVPAAADGVPVGVLTAYWRAGFAPAAADRRAVEAAAQLWALSRRRPEDAEGSGSGTHDPLTGLPNRTLLVDHLSLALAAAALGLPAGGAVLRPGRLQDGQQQPRARGWGRRPAGGGPPAGAAVRPADTLARLGATSSWSCAPT